MWLKEIVVCDVDEELAGGAVGIGRTRHGGRAPIIGEPLAASLRMGLPVGFLAHIGGEAPPWIMNPGITRWNMTLS